METRDSVMDGQLTDYEIAAINDSQRRGRFHPLTCGSGKRGDEAHRAYAEAHDDRDEGLLVADKDGLYCPVCNYRQSKFPVPPDARVKP